MNKYQIIRCPYCGAEYLPGEIFLPKHFLGQPKNISKDFTGKILEYEGLPQNLVETYTCDKCLSNFKVIANIIYTVKEEFESKDTYTQKL